jgi:hypothetical protein
VFIIYLRGVFKTSDFIQEHDVNAGMGGPLRCFCDDDLCGILFTDILLVISGRWNEHDDIRILLEAARFAQVRKAWDVYRYAVSTARESCAAASTGRFNSLARNFKLREMYADFLHTIVIARSPDMSCSVIHDDEIQVKFQMQTAGIWCASAPSQRGGIIQKDFCFPQYFDGVCEKWPFFILQVTQTQALCINARFL